MTRIDKTVDWEKEIVPDEVYVIEPDVWGNLKIIFIDDCEFEQGDSLYIMLNQKQIRAMEKYQRMIKKSHSE